MRLILFLVFRFRSKFVAWELINVNWVMKALAFITYQGGNMKKGLFQT